MVTEIVAMSYGILHCQETLRTAMAIAADRTIPVEHANDLRMNEPRYVTLPNIMKAKNKPLEVLKPTDRGMDVKSRIKTLKVSEPPRLFKTL